MRSNRNLAACAVVMALSVGTGIVRADTYYNPSIEYLNRIKVGETVQPLGDTPFGETLSLYTGTVSFHQTDINVPGIGPDIVLTRAYEASGSPTSFSFDLAMADWDLAVPELTTIVPGKRFGSEGTWRIGTSTGLTEQRCSNFGVVSQAPYGYGRAWWHGYQLITGDGHSQPVLKRTAGNTLVPNGNIAAYPALTPEHWVLSCLATTSNGMAGEGFLATAPDGTRYWFDHLSYGPALETLVEQVPTGGATTTQDALTTSTSPGSDTGEGDPNIYDGGTLEIMPRRAAHLYATRVEDRFGNWVTYSYVSGQLKEINASDGRKVTVAWRSDAPLVDRIVVQPDSPQARTWKYEYAEPTNSWARQLVRVIQPDLTEWYLETGWASAIRLPSADPDNVCGGRTYVQTSADDDYAVIFMSHPSGLTGQFNLSVRGHARSWVPTTCAPINGSTNPPAEHLPPVYLSLSLTSKIFSGPGVQPLTWNYKYSPAAGSTASECSTYACRETQWVEVTDPTNQTVHYTYSTKWGYSEGKLLSTVAAISQLGTDSPTGLQSEALSYADPERVWPYPVRLGQAMQDPISFSNNDPTEILSPQTAHEIVRQQVRFSREVLSFDRFGQPETVRRWSSPGDSRTETTTYWPVDGQWVLGQPWKVSDGSRILSQVDYDSRILPLRNYSFGQLQGTFSYAPNGMLQSMTDGRSYTTTLADHKRGIPQTITFADKSVLSPQVDDFGQVVGVRNQLSDTTSYQYDNMGRLTLMKFPDNDSVAWNPVSRSFSRANVVQYGLPIGHWMQTVQTGAAQVTTLYDALWRPRVTITQDLANPDSRSFSVSRFDGAGREVFRSYPVSSLASVDQPLSGTGTSYDGLGRVTAINQDSELGVLSTTREYLPGFRTLVTNPRKFQTTTSYQTFDVPSEEAPTRIQSPQGVTTVIQRDPFGKPLTITRSGPAG